MQIIAIDRGSFRAFQMVSNHMRRRIHAIIWGGGYTIEVLSGHFRW
jgi:hypothetical protein